MGGDGVAQVSGLTTCARLVRQMPRVYSSEWRHRPIVPAATIGRVPAAPTA